jgi:methylenetetrahydrofolate--tRNA-(uracil-5-)-methyltransferase
MTDLTIIGGGLAGSEAAWQAAERGLQVDLYEMRPEKSTGAHISGSLAELVCSNSLGSALLDRATGLLKEELVRMGSLLIKVAEKNAVPAGGALAVDRVEFASQITQAISKHPNIRVIRAEALTIPTGPTIIASGPLTSPTLAGLIQSLAGMDNLFFFDALAPILTAESIDMNIAYRASRYGQGELDDGDYINCPLSPEQYQAFYQELVHAQRIQLRDFEEEIKGGVTAGSHFFFERCQPVEIIAESGPRSLLFGPMRPIGLRDPRTGKGHFAIVQLRQDNLSASLYNIVGFQTNLTFLEQKRVFHLIPGLENAEFARFGQMHRNTFLSSPSLLRPTLQHKEYSNLFFAGQIVGVEGYLGNIATGLLAGINAARLVRGLQLVTLPPTCMTGALCHYITHADPRDFQPMKANWGLLPIPVMRYPSKRDRSLAMAQQALNDLDGILTKIRIER